MTTPQAQLSKDLYAAIVDAYYAMDAPARLHSHWVMNAEWLDELKKMTDCGGVTYWRPGAIWLMGKPWTVRADGGFPHLEPDE